MRISDWSSDVCSSDLRFNSSAAAAPARRHAATCSFSLRERRCQGAIPAANTMIPPASASAVTTLIGSNWTDGSTRSEEHTSELQSLMRISYAVFCLKKKNKHIHEYRAITSDTVNKLKPD